MSTSSNAPRRSIKPLFPNEINYPKAEVFSRSVPGDMRHPDDKTPDKTPKRKFRRGEFLRKVFKHADMDRIGKMKK